MSGNEWPTHQDGLGFLGQEHDVQLIFDSASDLSNVGKFLQHLPEDTRSLFLKLKSDESFGLAENAVKSLDNDNKTLVIRRGIAGYFFENLSYLYLKEKLIKEDKILLSPGETLEIYYMLYPNREKRIQRFGLQKSIGGVSVPDGIILGFSPSKRSRVMIGGPCGYSLRKCDDIQERVKLEQTLNLFRLDMRRISGPITNESATITDFICSKYPRFPSDARYNVDNDAKLLILSPQDIRLPFASSEIEEVPMPISSFTFGLFVNAFMADGQGVMGPI